MKKFLFLFVLTFFSTIAVNAQQWWFQTTGFKQCRVQNGYYQWPSQWQPSNVRICIDIDNDLVTIYSPRTQCYGIYGSYNNGNSYRDSGGGNTLKYYAVDQDGDRCEIRLRVDPNNTSQIYVDFSNIAWVYNVKRIY